MLLLKNEAHLCVFVFVFQYLSVMSMSHVLASSTGRGGQLWCKGLNWSPPNLEDGLWINTTPSTYAAVGPHTRTELISHEKKLGWGFFSWCFSWHLGGGWLDFQRHKLICTNSHWIQLNFAFWGFVPSDFDTKKYHSAATLNRFYFFSKEFINGCLVRKTSWFFQILLTVVK